MSKITSEQLADIDVTFPKVLETIKNRISVLEDRTDLPQPLTAIDKEVYEAEKGLAVSTKRLSDAMAIKLTAKSLSGYPLTEEQQHFMDTRSEMLSKLKEFDGKYSESEVVEAKQIAGELFQLDIDRKAGKISTADSNKKVDEIVKTMRDDTDSSRLATDYISANTLRKADLKEPNKPESTMWGAISGANKENTEKYNKEVTGYIAQRDNYKSITDLDLKDDKVLQNAMKTLAQTELVDDMEPKGNNKIAPNTTVAPEAGAEIKR